MVADSWHSFVSMPKLGPASQLSAGVAGTITNLGNYDNEGVDRNSSLMSGVDGGISLEQVPWGNF